MAKATMPATRSGSDGGQADRPPDRIAAQADEDRARRRRGVHDGHDVVGDPLRPSRRPGPWAGPERPLPRPSNVTTRKWRLRYGTWPFHWREWTIGVEGRRTRVGVPAP